MALPGVVVEVILLVAATDATLMIMRMVPTNF